MGEQKEGVKNEAGEKKKTDEEKTDDPGRSQIVLKLDLHCEGCAKRVRKFLRNSDGVEDVKADCANSKVMVFGKADAEKLREKLEEKTKKKVEILSQPKKEPAAGKKPDEKNSEDNKAADAKPKPAPISSTVVLKLRLHCDGCIHKIRKIISKYKGVENVSVDGAKDTVTVRGGMDVKVMVPYLKQKLRRIVELVPEKKNEGGEKEKKDGGEKEKEVGGGGGKKKEISENAPGGGGEKKGEKEGGGEKKEEGGAKVEVNRMEYCGYAAHPSYWYGDAGYVYGHDHVVERQGPPPPPPTYHEVPVHQGYPVEQYPLPYHAPQMFSDENPNACSVM